eukprot:7128168-Prymnesium_polylepis.2
MTSCGRNSDPPQQTNKPLPATDGSLTPRPVRCAAPARLGAVRCPAHSFGISNSCLLAACVWCRHGRVRFRHTARCETSTASCSSGPLRSAADTLRHFRCTMPRAAHRLSQSELRDRVRA